MERLRYELSFHETAYKHMYVFVIQLIVGCCCMLYVVVVVVVGFLLLLLFCCCCCYFRAYCDLL